MRKPTFFISSTIYDFQDLRSSLKFYLEEQGCKVLASEYNDFVKDLDKHSYDACLKSIEQADYFILLVGTRVGGWIDPSQKISITQAEYRHAYELHREGKLRIVNFVRSNVWQIREQRNELIKYLKDCSINELQKISIANYPSKFSEDAEFITKFLNEISRSNETKTAIEEGSSKPTNNWVHTFSNFQEIITVIQTLFYQPHTTDELTSMRLLNGEIREILSSALIKFSNREAFSPKFAVKEMHSQYPLTLESRRFGSHSVGVKTWDLFSSCALGLLSVSLHPVILPELLSSSTFLTFDRESNKFVEGPIYKYLSLLRKEISIFEEWKTNETISVAFKHSPKERPKNVTSVDFEFKEIATLIFLCDRWVNIIDLCVIIIKYFETGKIIPVKLRPRTPIAEMEKAVEDERVNDSDIDAFLANYVPE